MAIETHDCPVASCSRACPRHHLMCIEHWRMVPKALRTAVYAADRAVRRGHSLEALRALREESAAAIAAVDAKLEARAARAASAGQEDLFLTG